MSRPTQRGPLLLLAFTTAAAAAGCGKTPPSSPGVPPIPVTIVQLEADSVAAPVTATGRFESRDEIDLAFKIGGVVTRVLVDEGDEVRRGQLLASLDLREIDATVARATAAALKAERDVARLRRLVDDSVVTRVQLQDAMSALDVARADLAAAQVNREYATIHAPERGIVLARYANAGSTVGTGNRILRLGGNARGRVLRAGLVDRDAVRVRVGDNATVQFDAYPGRVIPARVSLVGASADVRTGTYAVELQLRDADGVPSGLIGRVTITPRASTLAALVPVEALVEADRDTAVVYTVRAANDSVASRRAVRIVGVHGAHAAVTGIDGAHAVITRGATYVSDSAPIVIVGDAPSRRTARGGTP